MLAVGLQEEEAYDAISYNEQEESIADMLDEMMEAHWSYNHIDTSSYEDVKRCYDELQCTREHGDDSEDNDTDDNSQDTDLLDRY